MKNSSQNGWCEILESALIVQTKIGCENGSICRLPADMATKSNYFSGVWIAILTEKSHKRRKYAHLKWHGESYPRGVEWWKLLFFMHLGREYQIREGIEYIKKSVFLSEIGLARNKSFTLFHIRGFAAQ